MLDVTWDDEARCELNCSALYLAKRGGQDLAARFLHQVDVAVTCASSDPCRYRKVHRDVRRVRVERFPYHVVYWHDETNQSVHIIVIAHTSRAPEYWSSRSMS